MSLKSYYIHFVFKELVILVGKLLHCSLNTYCILRPSFRISHLACITFCRDNFIALLHQYYYILRRNIINNNSVSFEFTSTIAPQLTAIYFLSRRTVQTLTFVWTALQRATAKKRRHPTAKITSLQAQSRESPYSCVILHLYLPINGRLSKQPVSAVPKIPFAKRFDCIYSRLS